jgi:hypothetical protein
MDTGASIAPYNHFEFGQPILIDYVWGRQVGENTITNRRTSTNPQRLNTSHAIAHCDKASADSHHQSPTEEHTRPPAAV